MIQLDKSDKNGSPLLLYTIYLPSNHVRTCANLGSLQPRYSTTTDTGPFLIRYQSSTVLSKPSASYPSANRISSFCIIRQMIIFISSSAKFLPTQLLGPNENGMKAVSLCTNCSEPPWYFSSPSAMSQRSGQKVFGYRKLRESRWTDQVWMVAFVPSGMKLRRAKVSVKLVL